MLKVEGLPLPKEPKVPFVEGLDITYQGSSVVGSGVSIFTYRIAAKKTGEYIIGPIYIESQRGLLTSNTVSLTVSKGAYSPPTVYGSVPKDISKNIYLRLELPKNIIYVNERLPVQIKLFSDWFDLEDIVFNEIVMGEILADKLVKVGSEVIDLGDKKFAVLSYNTKISVPTPGDITIEPVKASLNIASRKPLPSGELPPLLNDNEMFYKDYLGGRDKVPVEVNTDPVSLKVSPLPLKGRPDSFSGAVGNFNFEAGINTAKVKIGGEIRLRLVVSGEGNYATFNTISIPQTDGIRPYEPVIKRGADSFVLEQTFRIASPDIREMPAVTFAYFDPNRESYLTVTKGPFPVVVEAIEPKEPLASPEKEQFLGKPPAESLKKKDLKQQDVLVGLKEDMGAASRFNPYLYSGVGPFVVQIMPIFLVLAAVVIKNRMNFLEADNEYAAWLRMSKRSVSEIARAEKLLRHGRTKEFYDHIFFFMQYYLGTRIMVHPEGITEKTVGDVIGEKLGDEELLQKINKIFADCYLARFTSAKLSAEDMKDTLEDLKSVLGRLNNRTYLLNI